MSIEIRELVIRAVVADDPDRHAAQDGKAASSEIVEACVREVLEILRRSEVR